VDRKHSGGANLKSVDACTTRLRLAVTQQVLVGPAAPAAAAALQRALTEGADTGATGG
jgi:phosphotransferase system IIB component